ncbi:MAG: VCBS repeat-containing protein [Thalassobaculum sp.]|uniref:FG-GAP repeat domain-containing protein n=1 Tax=Thalassobaculum sp. TaxID=2022740 RepID=UPI0032EB201B
MRRTALAGLAAFGLAVLAGPGQATAERLPDGGIAEAAGQGVVRAWYERPTGRYGHGVLGDAIEGGSLVAVDPEGRRHEHVLPVSRVFEDITPRLADLDGDGRNEVVAIRSDLASGAAVAVYGIRDGALVEIAATAPIGSANRWLSIAAIADFLGDGVPRIAVVRTPHLSGVLELLELRGERLARIAGPAAGYSTHAIGSRVLSLAAVVDVDGDAAADLALPDLARRRVVLVGFAGGLRVLGSHGLPGRVTDRIRVVAPGRLAVPLEDGGTAEITLR